MISFSPMAARLGAISYVIWALLHLMAAVAVYQLGLHAGLTMAGGRLLQDAWNLAAFSIFGAAVAVRLNWRNDAWGYWINFAIISVADVGFILFILVPGYMPFWPGIAGPFFWVVGLFMTSYAQVVRGKLE